MTEFADKRAGGLEASSRSSTRTLALPAAILSAGILLAAILALPGRTITSKYVNDLLIFLDGAYRISLGQVPNVDFHTSLGPLAFYVPAAGYAITGSMGAAMPAGMALVVLLCAVLAAVAISSRMSGFIGLPLAVFLLLVLAVPANPGEAIGDLSFAMFYNRIGWAALGLLFVFQLPRRADAGRADGVDAACASLLILLMLYTKITYGLVGIGFLLLLLLWREQRRMALVALAATAGAVVLIEAFWRGGWNHLEDLRLAGAVSGGLPSPHRLLDVALRNLADLIVYAIFAVILLFVTRDPKDLLFPGFCAGSGLLLIEQNFQGAGILTLSAGAAIMTEGLLRLQPASDRQRPVAGLPLLLAVLMLPPTGINAVNLGMHAAMAVAGAGEDVPLPRFSAIRLVATTGPGPHARFHRYNESLADGAKALASLGAQAERVVVLDFENPFSAGLGLAPPRGDSVWYHWGRTLDHAHFPAPDEIFADAQVILDPKWPVERWTADGMRDIYRDYIAAHFEQVRETEDWRLYRRLR